MKKTPLYNEHIALAAQMTAFSSWQMPLSYSGFLSEYDATRRSVAIFDTSHMGQIRISGERALAFIEFLFPRDFSKSQDGRCYYTYLCKEDGSLLDDLLVYRISETEFFLVVNAGTTQSDTDWITEQQQSKSCWSEIVVKDESDLWFKIDIQGPQSSQILSKKIVNASSLEKLSYFSFTRVPYKDSFLLLSRTGYTGELGYEIYGQTQCAVFLWKELLNLGVKPAGLGVRDMLRLDMGYPLMGQDFDSSLTPLSLPAVRLQWPSTPHLISKKKLPTPQWAIVGYTVEDSSLIPRKDASVFQNDHPIGCVTSGSWSPFLKKSIGLAKIPWKLKNEKNFFITVRKHRVKVKVFAPPFLKTTSLKDNSRKKGTPHYV